MMASGKDGAASLREALESLAAPEVVGPLDELASVLVMISGALGRFRRVLAPNTEHAVELSAIDRSFSRSIVLTREIRERIEARRPRGEYTSATHVAREVVGKLQGVLPDDLTLGLQCASGPAIVATDRGELRCVMAGLVEAAIEAASRGGRVDLEVSELPGPAGDRQRRIVQIELRSSNPIDERGLRLATVVRPLVRAFGGTVTFREPMRGGTAITVRLAGVC